MALGGALERMEFVLTGKPDDAVRAFKTAGDAADRELGKAEQRIDRTAKAMQKWGAGAVVAGGLVGGALLSTIGPAQRLEAAGRRVETFFGSSAPKIEQWGRGAANALGLSESAALGAAGTFGKYAGAAGMAGDEAVRFATSTTEAAVAAAALAGENPAEAVDALGAAFRGEYDPAERFGFALTAAKVEARGLELGMVDAAGKVTDAGKAVATQQLILEQAEPALRNFGDATQSSAFKAEQAKAQFENLRAQIGEGLLPVVGAAADGVGRFLGVLNSLPDGAKNAVGTVGAVSAGLLTVAGSVSFAAGKAIEMRDRFTTLGTDGTRSLTRVGTAVTGLATGVAAAGVAIAAVGLYDSLTKDGEAAERSLTSFLAAAGDSTAQFNDRLEAFAKTADETFDNSSSVSQSVRILGKGMDDAAINASNLGDAFEAVLAKSPEIAQTLVDDMLRLSDEVNNGNESARKWAEAWGVNAELVRGWQQRIDDVTGAQDALTAAANKGTTAVDAHGNAIDAAGKATGVAASNTEELADALDGVAAGAQEYLDATRSTDWGAADLEGAAAGMARFREQHDGLADRVQQWETALDGFAASLVDVGLNLDLSTEAGRSQRDALQSVADVLDQDFAAAYRAADGDMGKFKTSADQIANDTLAQLAAAGNLSAGEIETLRAELGLTEGDYEARFTLSGAEEARAKLDLLQGSIDALPPDVQTLVTQKIIAGDYVGALAVVDGYYKNHPATINVNGRAWDVDTARANAHRYYADRPATMNVNGRAWDVDTARANAHRYYADRPATLDVNGRVWDVQTARGNAQAWYNRNPVTIPVNAISRLFAAGGMVGSGGGIAGENYRPEILNDRYLIAAPTPVPAGTRVRGERETEGLLAGLDAGGDTYNNTYVTIHAPAGTTSDWAVSAIRRYDRRNGTRVGY